MKYPLLIFTLTFFITNSVSARTILLCLGKEESYYAKNKDTGPKYHLNQIMINEISAVGNPDFAGNNYKKFCSHPDQMPALKLLKALTLGEKKLFAFKDEEGGLGVQYAIATYDEFRLKSIKILIDYIAKIQLQSKSATCLTDNIDGLKEFYARFRYLEGEVSMETLKGSKNDLLKIYQSLENIEEIYKKCSRPNSAKSIK